MTLDYTWERREELIRQEEYEEGKREGRREGQKEGRREGRKEGQRRGEKYIIINLVCKKVQKGKSLEQIAAELEEDVMKIQPIYDAVVSVAPDYDTEAVRQKLDEIWE